MYPVLTCFATLALLDLRLNPASWKASSGWNAAAQKPRKQNDKPSAREPPLHKLIRT
jgi:hypothetical protein